MFPRVALLFAVAVAVTFAELPPNYEALEAAQKQDILWQQIAANPYPTDDLPIKPYDAITSLQLLQASFDKKAFTWEGDEMIADRPKLIHTYGSAAKVELLISKDSEYTGVFAPGKKIGIARFSVAAIDPDNFVPGTVTKILVDGKPSINLFAMNSVDGQGKDFNFFKLPFTNFIPNPVSPVKKFLAAVFREAIDELPGGKCDRPLGEGKLPLFTAALQYVNGSVEPQPKAPLVYFFQPNSALGWNGDDTTDLRLQLAKIPVQSVLYTISVAISQTGPQEVIGKLVLKSQFVASEYEDQILFFNHASKRC